MNRRSVTFYPVIEQMVREFQAVLLVKLNRDINFTDALNLLLVNIIATGNFEQFKKSPAADRLAAFLDADVMKHEPLLDSWLAASSEDQGHV